MPDWAGRENVETAKDVEHKKLVALDWLRAATVLMLLYDHIGAYRNPEWEIKKLVDFFIVDPFNIIFDFGMLGNAIFFLISGVLFIYNRNHLVLSVKPLKKILKFYLTSMSAFLCFWAVQTAYSHFQPTYWSSFTTQQWIESMTMYCYFIGKSDVINGTTWFLLPMGLFYLVTIPYTCMYKYVGEYAILFVDIALAGLFLSGVCNNMLTILLLMVYLPLAGIIIGNFLFRSNERRLCRCLALSAFNWMIFIYLWQREVEIIKAAIDVGPLFELSYFVSCSYAYLLVILGILLTDCFTQNRLIQFICRISLSVYVLQMTFGSFVIALFTSMGINYTIAFFMAVGITLLLSFAHYEIVEQKILRRIIH